jgi:hypothetical protein
MKFGRDNVDLDEWLLFGNALLGMKQSRWPGTNHDISSDLIKRL